ncbi:hypothetical protein FOA52_005139 [Chlamydomonas sp. UWO 241]|nr:hypothetical protein FOA52_005139 [Chlamydomonas sp. UWO 241]
MVAKDNQFIVAPLRVHMVANDSEFRTAVSELQRLCRSGGCNGGKGGPLLANELGGVCVHCGSGVCDGLKVHQHKNFGHTYGMGPDTDQQFRYCIVLERATRTLQDALLHDNFATADFDKVRKLARDLVASMSHLHSKRIVHADIKPLNVCEIGANWKLVDLDLSARVGGKMGMRKLPSTAYAPPEAVRAVRDGTEARADVAMDLWGLGATLYMAATGCTLVPADMRDNVRGGDDAWRLAHWTTADRDDRLQAADLMQSNGGKRLADLLSKLLEPDPEVRTRHWGSPTSIDVSKGLLSHVFLAQSNANGRADSDGDLLNMGETLSRIEHCGACVDAHLLVLQGLRQAQRILLLSLMSGKGDAPTLLLPMPVKGAFSGWTSTRLSVYCVDAVSLERAPMGLEDVVFTREALVKAMPYLTVSLTVLKMGALSASLTGVSRSSETATLITQLLADLEYVRRKDCHGQDEAAMKAVDRAVRMALDTKEADPNLPKLLRASGRDAKYLLNDCAGKGWKSETGLERVEHACGMACGQIECGGSGSLVAWVLPHNAQPFHAYGLAMRDMRSKRGGGGDSDWDGESDGPDTPNGSPRATVASRSVPDFHPGHERRASRSISIAGPVQEERLVAVAVAAPAKPQPVVSDEPTAGEAVAAAGMATAKATGRALATGGRWIGGLMKSGLIKLTQSLDEKEKRAQDEARSAESQPQAAAHSSSRQPTPSSSRGPGTAQYKQAQQQQQTMQQQQQQQRQQPQQQQRYQQQQAQQHQQPGEMLAAEPPPGHRRPPARLMPKTPAHR